MVNAALKRMTDIVVSMGVLLVIWPLLIIIAILIKLDSKGPGFYRSVRVGKHGKHFRMFKFRTMIVGAERLGGAATPEDDPRITRLGYHIRRLNLDELPQFINVLKGDMSIVGPRPEVPQYVALFTDEEKEILLVRPGITDWATIWVADLGNILAGSEDPERMQREKVWPEKHRLNLEYVRHHSWWTDIQIMFVTLKIHLLDRLFTKRRGGPQSSDRWLSEDPAPRISAAEKEEQDMKQGRRIHSLEGIVKLKPVPEMDPVQLLGRKPTRLDQEAILEFIRGKRLLVTGAAGSVGSEMAKQIAQLQPGLLLAVDRAENPLFFFESEFQQAFPQTPLVALVSDVTDRAEMSSMMARYRPQVVFHAAAYKHVSLMERAPREAVKNNVGGTYTVARCAREAGVEKFVLVSTDKSVKPSSVMGATKRLAEMVVMEMDRTGSTRFLVVRFGNVLGSNASVAPIFARQIAAGGPVTVTHREATRYFMSLSEAAGLILQAAAMGTGNEIFLLDMGEPVSILALAEKMIRLARLKPYEDIQIVFTGLRPGEKLLEELSYRWENFQPTAQEKLRVFRNAVSYGGILPSMEQFIDALAGLDGDAVKARLSALVPEYRPG